jgi:3-oxoacyl-[acyl-carrier protein] reductase
MPRRSGSFIATRWPTRATPSPTVRGLVPVEQLAAIPAATREAGRRLSCLVQGGLPVDIAEAVTFLATPGAYGVNGRVVRVCVGAYLGA